jgi:hypothetical protein
MGKTSISYSKPNIPVFYYSMSLNWTIKQVMENGDE